MMSQLNNYRLVYVYLSVMQYDSPSKHSKQYYLPIWVCKKYKNIVYIMPYRNDWMRENLHITHITQMKVVLLT